MSAPDAVRVLPMGERALLLEVGSLEAAMALHARLEASRPEGVVDLVPAARTVLLRVDPARLSVAAARAWAANASADAAAAASGPPRLVELEVSYDGADLASTAALLGVSVDELVRRHAGAEWTVAFTGFAPGFGYLVSPQWSFDVPRLPTPRTRVPRGSVGLAAGFTGAYPRETPGGWRLIGTTTAPLFDPHGASPALLAPGGRVRFRPARAGAVVGAPVARSAAGSAAVADAVPGSAGPVAATAVEESACSAVVAASGPGAAAGTGKSAASPDGVIEHSAAGREPVSAPHAAGSDASAPARARADCPTGSDAADPAGTAGEGIRILEPGLLATLQDLGRPGSAALGVAASGALDRTALRTANRLLGNPEGAAGIEVTMGGMRAVAVRDLWFAVTGAWGPIRLDGHEVDPYQAHPWPAGAQLQLDWFAHGARAYLTVRGGIEAAPVLGSRSTDVLAGLGPRPLRADDALRVGTQPGEPIPVAAVAPWGAPHDAEVEVELAPGPRADWFAASAHRALFEQIWTVGNDADRVGMRLDGPALERVREAELPSEGMVAGALQVPPDGRPTILLADGPVTGGYPVIAVATDAALDVLAQVRPGTRVRFRHARPV